MAATPLIDGDLLYIGYAALAWGYGYLSPTGITAATPLIDGDLLYIGYTAIA
jgi:hypothetical protein